MTIMNAARRLWLATLVPGLAALSCVVLSLPVAPTVAGAQYLTRPNIPWRTQATEHFDIHYPAEMQAWTESMARRLESVASAVNVVTGHRPANRITVIVEDPSNVSNGFALPFLEGPVMFLFPTPPSPSPTFGTHRGWGEILAVHEYGHIAHLTWPSRNGWDRLVTSLLPVRIGPVTWKAPPWVVEGYATYIEGRLTGSGRPSSVGRAAVMRQWALEGKFPTYGQLSASGSYLGGNMRYLVGSAFLEWLEDRRGDSSLVHLWRRMSARERRSFDQAFVGVFGASPADLYGAFTVEVMERSLAARNELTAAGLVNGELVQRLVGSTGDPAVSPDGKRIAIAVRSLNGPSRLVVWRATPPDDDAEVHRLRQRMLQADPLDVAPVDSFPRPRKASATLHPAGGRSHENPRWMPDGDRVLVTRDEPTADGVMRPDLFLWNTVGGGIHRVTHGAGIRQADPSPDGTQAAGVRCHAGVCSLVLVNLRSGSWRLLAEGSPDTVWHRPRFSPDGALVAASMHANGKWHVAVVDAMSGAVRTLAAQDGFSRHSPAFLASGREVVVVSERGGVANLEVLGVDDGHGTALTRVTGAVLAPDVNRADGSVAFLSMRTGGLDLRRLASTIPGSAAGVVALPDGLAPAAPPGPGRGQAFAVEPLQPPREYGLGPRRWRVLPGGQFGPDGSSGTLMVANIDPISRVSVVAQGGFGPRGTWRGGSLSLGMRRTAVALDLSGWSADHYPSEQQAGLFAPPTADLRTRGVGVVAKTGRETGLAGYTLRGGATASTVSGPQLDAVGRVMALGDARLRFMLGLGRNAVHLAGGVLVNVGTIDGESFQRIIGSGTITIGTSRRYLRGDWKRGGTDEAGPGEAGRASEEFLVGGHAAPFFDPAFMSQRVPLPSVPSGFVSGHRFEMFRASIGGMSWEPYAIWIAAGEGLDDVKRIAGLEKQLAFPSMGFVTLPAVRILVGAGYSFDVPYQYRTRAYASVTYSP